jgi:large subunit ribosomal protein L29
MKYFEIKNLSLEALKSKIDTEANELIKMKFAHSVSPIENSIRIRNKRRLIARLKTNLSARNK